MDEPEEAISVLNNITSNEDQIGQIEIGVTTILLETLSDDVNQNRNVSEQFVLTCYISVCVQLSEGFLVVVDNLLDVDEEDIQMSQQESNTSARY